MPNERKARAKIRQEAVKMSPQSFLRAFERQYELFCILHLFEELLAVRASGNKTKRKYSHLVPTCWRAVSCGSQRCPGEKEVLAGKQVWAGRWEVSLSAKWGHSQP